MTVLRANFAKFSFQKYPQRPAFTRRGPGHTLTPYQTDDDTERQLVHTLRLAPSDAVVFIISMCCLYNFKFGGGIYFPLSSRTARLTKARPAQAVTLLAWPDSESLRPGSGSRKHVPKPAAGRHSSHSRWPAVTRHSPPQSTRPRHSPRPVSLGWRRGPPLLAAARLAASVTRRSRGAKAEVYVVARIWNTLIAICGTP